MARFVDHMLAYKLKGEGCSMNWQYGRYNDGSEDV